MKRYEVMQQLLDNGEYFKLVCGAGNEDPDEIEKLAFVYTLAGAKGIDVAALPDVVSACALGIDKAYHAAEKHSIEIGVKPFIMISVGMPGDHHVRKAFIDHSSCITCNLCIPVCPTDAIPTELVVIDEKCIGCGNCEAICPVNDTIVFKHNEKALDEVIPECLQRGAEHIELHAAIADDTFILEEWKRIVKTNPYNHNSISLDRLHQSNFELEERIRQAKEIAGDKFIVQADGHPMSGGKNDYNTTLQAIATADIINKAFNKTIDKKTKLAKYKNKNVVDILLSGGTNALSNKLARQCDVRFQGVALGTYARNIIKEFIQQEGFMQNEELIKMAVGKAAELVRCSISKE